MDEGFPGETTPAEDRVPAGDPQGGLMDRDIEDDALEALLDRREDRKAEKSAATAAFKEVDDAVKARIGEFELADGEVARVGKYRIEKKATQGRSVSFDTAPSSRLQIKLFDA
jgi:hypothetical protein